MKSILYLLLSIFFAVNVSAQQNIHTAKKEDFKDDWAALSHYKAENKQLGEPTPGEKQVIFLGSSIFEFWKAKAPEFYIKQ